MNSDAQKRQAFRDLLKAPGIVVAPGAYDAVMARLIERNGFPCVYVTGGGISRSLGYPDLGLLAMNEIVDRVGAVARSVGVPVLADGDTGYGNALNVRRAVQEFERAGVTAMQLEDEETPKKCVLLTDVGHKVGIISRGEMVGKIRAACAAREDPNFAVVGRVCLRGDQGFQEVLDRALAYEEAGADVMFLVHLTPEQLARACEALTIPVAYNATFTGEWARSSTHIGRTFDELERLGLKIALLSSSVALGGLLGMQKLLNAVRRDGEVATFFAGEDGLNELSSFYTTTGAPEAVEWEARYLAAEEAVL